MYDIIKNHTIQFNQLYYSFSLSEYHTGQNDKPTISDHRSMQNNKGRKSVQSGSDVLVLPLTNAQQLLAKKKKKGKII